VAMIALTPGLISYSRTISKECVRLLIYRIDNLDAVVYQPTRPEATPYFEGWPDF